MKNLSPEEMLLIAQSLRGLAESTYNSIQTLPNSGKYRFVNKAELFGRMCRAIDLNKKVMVNYLMVTQNGRNN